MHPLESVKWGERTANLQGGKRQMRVIAPEAWSDTAVDVFASHYLRVVDGEQETHFGQAIGRVAGTISGWATEDGYLSDGEAHAFRAELEHMLVYQMWSPNSPVWYNIGCAPRPQISACFIQSVRDSMEGEQGIIALQGAETRLFMHGSGTGTNLSTLRPNNWPTSRGGTSSGPVSFMRGFDGWAGVTKSGGKTRRAAKMTILNANHPDIFDFISDKAEAERMANALIDAGWPADYNSKAYSWLPFQNANNSVRVTDEFMHAVKDNKQWSLTWDGKTVQEVHARDLWDAACKAAWHCGDPGLQFHTTANRWHTSPAEGEINASNPCSEYFFLDDSACNLASLNLRKFKKPDEPFQVNRFGAACERSILAQEVMVSRANYPTRMIGLNSEKYRPLGLGYSNLGALLMSEGLAYDSPEGCAYAAVITALMTASAYQASQKIAAIKGPYEGSRIGDNAKAMREVLDRHASALNAVPWTTFDDHKNVALAAAETFMKVVNSPVLPRNAQVTLLAPTGTISFGMDCDTFGIEPDFSLVKHKRMAGGGFMKYANRSIESALCKLDYKENQINKIIEHVEEHETLDNCPMIWDHHRSVFDCAVPAKKGWRSISFEGHVNMMAAVQPFLSGAISKTVNLPHTATVEDISRAYMMAWEKGLKAIAIYRDGCKRSQPLDTGARDSINYKHPHVQRALAEVAAAVGLVGESWTASSLGEQIKLIQPQRHRLPDTRQSLCHRFSVGGHDGYLHPGFHADGSLGEIFVRMAKEGSTVSGLLDAWATVFSIALQYGAPLEKLCEKGMGTSFPPSGFTGDEIRSAKSVVDYICSWLHKHYCQPNTSVAHATDAVVSKSADTLSMRVVSTSAETSLTAGNPPCGACGGDTVRAGSCYTCTKCGTTTGCG